MLLENSTVLQIVLIHRARARSEGFCAQMRTKKSARNLPCGLTLRGKRELIGPEHLPIGLLKYLLCRSHKTGQLSYRGTLRKTSMLQLMGHCMSRSALMSSFSTGGGKKLVRLREWEGPTRPTADSSSSGILIVSVFDWRSLRSFVFLVFFFKADSPRHFGSFTFNLTFRLSFNSHYKHTHTQEQN